MRSNDLVGTVRLKSFDIICLSYLYHRNIVRFRNGIVSVESTERKNIYYFFPRINIIQWQLTDSHLKLTWILPTNVSKKKRNRYSISWPFQTLGFIIDMPSFKCIPVNARCSRYDPLEVVNKSSAMVLAIIHDGNDVRKFTRTGLDTAHNALVAEINRHA